MKNIFKIIFVILSMFILSCGQKKEIRTSETKDVVPEENAKITIWETGAQKEKEYILYSIEEFKKLYPHVKIKIEIVQLGSVVEKVSQDIPAGLGPDIFAVPHDQIGTLITGGLIMENLVSVEDIRDRCFESAVNALEKEGIIYGFPVSMETYAIFYNKKLLKEMPKTFEEFIAIGKNFTDRQANKYAIVWEVPSLYYTHAFFAMDGGYIFGKNGTDAGDLGFDNKGAIDGINNMLKLKDISVERAEDGTLDVMFGLFTEGKVMAIITGPWSTENMKKAGMDFGITAFPTFGGKYPNTLTGVVTYQVNSFSKYPKAAQLFAKFITSEKMLLKRFEMTSAIPPYKALSEEKIIKENEYIVPFLEQLNHSTVMPSIREMSLIWQPFGSAINDTYNGKVSAEDGMKNLKISIQKQIESMDSK